jgi:hypothetical protein
VDRIQEITETPVWLRPELLIDFLMGLRLCGYGLGIEEFLMIQDLILALIVKGESFEDPERLASCIGPLVCKSPTQYLDFFSRFNSWLSLIVAQPRELRGSTDPIQRSNLEYELRDFWSKKRLRRYVGITIAIVMIALFLWIVVDRARR